MESGMATAIGSSCPTIVEEFSCPTPEQKSSLQKAASHGDMLDMSLSSGSASSEFSRKDGSAISSLTPTSESESESDFYVKRRVLQELNHDNAGIRDKIAEFGATKLEAMDEDSMLEKMKDNMCKNLLQKVAEYERELEVANKVIYTSQEEISRLRSELAETPTVTGVSKNLHDQFETLCVDVTKLQDDETKVLELQNTIARLEASLRDSDQSNAMLTEELRITKERLNGCENEELEFEQKLKTKIYEVTHEMQHQINSSKEVVRALETQLASERTKHDREIQELNFALTTAHDNFSIERSRFLSDISVLLKQEKFLQSKLDQAESRVKLLEDQVGQSILEKLEIRDLLEAQENQYQADLNQLNTELAQRREQVDVLNKSLDASKFKYDMLMTEKDELTAKVDTLNAQSNCGSIQIHQMEARLTELEAERSSLLAKLEGGERMVTELRLKVANLESEAEKQKDVISDRAEEKREAIRQLCFSLEYYRTEYHELCRAFSGLKRHPVAVQ